MDMYASFAERLAYGAKMIVPYALIIMLYMCSFIAAPQPFTLLFQMPFFLMALYYWSLFRPTLLPLWLVFIAGLGFDLLGGGILGVYALLFLVVRVFVTRQRRFLIGQTFMMIWLGYALLSSVFVLMQWAMLSVLSLQMLPIGESLLHALLSTVFFLPIYMMLHVAHQLLPMPMSKVKT